MRILESTPLIKMERIAVKMIAEVLRKHFTVEEIILFGSKSRGDDEKHSDIDLLIVTDQTLHWKDEKAIVELMFDTGMKYDVIFSPLFVSSEEWNKGIFTEFPVYKEIIRDGALVL
jgi:predicted nucleotidyltransferase